MQYQLKSKGKNNIIIFFVGLLIAGCVITYTFESGIAELDTINDKYKVDHRSMPASIENAVLMRNDLKDFKENNNNLPESLDIFLNYRLKALESNIINLKAWEEGNRASTREGFGCKAIQVVVNSSILRNISAQRGYEAVEILQEFIDKYPDEALSINITQRDVVFTNFFYKEVENEARRDRKIIEYFCIKDEESEE